MKNLLRLTIAFAFVVTLGAQAAVTPQATATIAGKWDVVNPNRPGFNSLDITADGKAVSGSFGGEAVRGEIAGSNVTFATPDTWLQWTDHSLGADDMKVSAATVSFATLKEDGTLSGRTDVFLRGYGQQAIKYWKWTATRAKAK